MFPTQSSIDGARGEPGWKEKKPPPFSRPANPGVYDDISRMVRLLLPRPLEGAGFEVEQAIKALRRSEKVLAQAFRSGERRRLYAADGRPFIHQRAAFAVSPCEGRRASGAGLITTEAGEQDRGGCQSRKEPIVYLGQTRSRSRAAAFHACRAHWGCGYETLTTSSSSLKRGNSFHQDDRRSVSRRNAKGISSRRVDRVFRAFSYSYKVPPPAESSDVARAMSLTLTPAVGFAGPTIQSGGCERDISGDRIEALACLDQGTRVGQ
jgi:hypothetical protein